MKDFVLKKLMSIACLLLALVWVFLAFTQYGVWVNEAPGSGFFPAIVGSILGLVSLTILFEKDTKMPKFHRDSLLLIGAAILIYIGTSLIGMLLSLMIFLLVWIRFFEKESWKTTLTIVISVSALIYFVFILWLGIAFPVGSVFAMLGF